MSKSKLMFDFEEGDAGPAALLTAQKTKKFSTLVVPAAVLQQVHSAAKKPHQHEEKGKEKQHQQQKK